MSICRVAPARVWRAISLIFVLGTLSGLSQSASALSLGEPVLQSYLGQPLHVRVPVNGLAELQNTDAACLRVVDQDDVDDVAGIRHAQGRIVSNSDGSYFDIVRAGALQEPVVRLTVESGCSQAVRRSFTLLLDPAPTLANAAGLDADAPHAKTGSALPKSVSAHFKPSEVQVLHGLGQPLSLRVPFTPAPGQVLASTPLPEVYVSTLDGDVLTLTLKPQWVQDSHGSALLIQSTEEVNEPALSLHLNLGHGTAASSLPFSLDRVIVAEAPAVSPEPAPSKQPAGKTAKSPTHPATRVSAQPAEQRVAKAAALAVATPSADALKAENARLQQLMDQMRSLDAEVAKLRGQLVMARAAQVPAVTTEKSKSSFPLYGLGAGLLLGALLMFGYNRFQTRTAAKPWESFEEEESEQDGNDFVLTMGTVTDPQAQADLNHHIGDTVPKAQAEPKHATLETIHGMGEIQSLTDLLRPVEVTELHGRVHPRELLSTTQMRETVSKALERKPQPEPAAALPRQEPAPKLATPAPLASGGSELSLADSGAFFDLNLDLSSPAKAPSPVKSASLSLSTLPPNAFEQAARVPAPDLSHNSSG